VRRDRRWRALYYLQSLRTRILVVAATERGLRTTELKGADDLPESLLDELRTTLVASVEPDELLRALRSATRIFLEQIRGAEPSLSDRLEAQLSALLE
jgi:hypothetical protein